MPDVYLGEIYPFYALYGVFVLEMVVQYRVHRPHVPRSRRIRRRYGFGGVYSPCVLRMSPALASRCAGIQWVAAFGLDFHELSDLIVDNRVLSLTVYVL